jgi:hypothetical protein
MPRQEIPWGGTADSGRLGWGEKQETAGAVGGKHIEETLYIKKVDEEFFE